MILADFLKNITEDGKAVFDSSDPPRDLGKPAEQTAELIKRLEQQRRLYDPDDPPIFEPQPAHLALGCLCRLSQYTVFREIPKERIEEEWEALFAPMIGLPSTSSTIWSVDVSLSFLPKLFRIAQTVAENDPLMQHIRQLARNWPLSGAGISGIEWNADDFAPILAHPTLSGILVDRVFESKDRKIAEFPSVRQRLDEAVGDYQKTLAPWLADVPVAAS